MQKVTEVTDFLRGIGRYGFKKMSKLEKMQKLTPIKAIRQKCLECQDNHYSLIKNCEAVDCPLHIYRLGRRPRRGDLKTGMTAN